MLTNYVQAQTYFPVARKANSYHVNFHLRVDNRVSAFVAEMGTVPAKLNSQLTAFHNAVIREDDFFKLILKSDLTPFIEEWDTKRDNSTSSLRSMSQAYAVNPSDAQKQAAGQRVLDLMHHYELNINDNYENQGSKTYQFCQAVDANTTYSDAIAAIGATTFYQGMKEANEQCRLLIDQRNEERAQAPHDRMVDLRARTDAEYRDLIMLLNAYALTAEVDHQFDPLLNVLNQDVTYYEKTVFAGSGSSNGSNNSNGSNGGNTNPTNDNGGNNGSNGTNGSNGSNGGSGTGGDSGGSNGNAGGGSNGDSGGGSGSGSGGGSNGGDSGGGDNGGGSTGNGNGEDE